jgi:flagellar basal-body rod protein FlgB
LDVAPDFAAKLQAKLKMAGGADDLDSVKLSVVEDATARSMRPDGNTVELERELLEMNRNSVEYDFLTEIVSRNIKQMRMAISGRSM